MVELRVVDQSSFAFETDLPPSSRDIHPSGVIHACRSSPSLSNGNPCSREEHAFAWIEDSLYIEAALQRLELNGFDCSEGAVFIPYSTKSNWTERYPHAAPALECTDEGEVVVYLNYRPYPNGLGKLGEQPEEKDDDDGASFPAATISAKESERTNRKKNTRGPNLLHDKARLPDVERDELHVEVYKYLSWLHGRLVALDRTAFPVAEGERANNMERARGRTRGQRRVDLPALRDALDKLEAAFYILPHVDADELELEGACLERGAPLLEVALGEALGALVEARKVDGKPVRRSRKRRREDGIEGHQDIGVNPFRSGPVIDREMGEFRGAVRRLERYVEQQGDFLTADQAQALCNLGAKGMGKKYDLFEHPDRRRRRVPPKWALPKLKIRPMYLLWHCGDDAKRNCPLKRWEKDDVHSMAMNRAQKTFGSLKGTVELIDNAAVANGVPPKAFMTRDEAHRCFDAGKGGLNISLVTPSGKPRDLEGMTWMTVQKYLPSKSPATAKTKTYGNTSLEDIDRQSSNYFRTAGVKQTNAGNWEVAIRYHDKVARIGTYRTQDQAAQINEFVRRKLEPSRGRKRSDIESEHDVLLAREAAENAVDCQRIARTRKKL